MFIIRLIRYLKGYIRFSLKGSFIERFLNLAARNNIAIWDGRRTNDVYQGFTLAKNYKKFRPLVRKTKIHARVEERHGMPFTVKKYRKRVGLLTGIICFLFVVSMFSQFIWTIEVVGNERVETAEIVQNLENLGLKKGTLRRSVDTKNLEELLLLSIQDLSWVAVNLKGSTATIELQERVLPPEKLDEQEPCNVVAKKAGQIYYMEVYAGQKVLQKGDTVNKGDVIVSGIVVDNSQKSYYRHARAKVLAELEESIVIEVPLTQTLLASTNEVIRYRQLDILGLKIPLQFGKNLPAQYDKRESQKQLKLLGIPLPMQLYTEGYVPLEERTVTITEEKARELALMDLEQFERSLRLNGEILQKTANGSMQNDKFVITAKYLCLQDIAVQEKILIN